MLSLHPYPSYRNTDLPWLGQIPAHWDVKRLKQVSDVTFSSVDKLSREDEKPVLLSNYVDVYKNEQITSELEFMKATASDDEIKRFTLRKNDVMITKDSESWDDIAIPAHVPEDLENVLCGYHLALIRPIPNMMDGKFLLRALQSKTIRYQFEVEATGITRYGIDQYAIGSTFFPVPPLPEQQAIAAYLDHQTTKIDTLIAKKERLLDLLAEQRAALISQAVTKGLNPDVKMKDSGVAWLGQVPSHWEVKPYKFIATRVDVGIAEAATHAYADSGVPIIRTTNVRANRVLTDDILHIEEWFAEKNKSKYMYAGDIVTVRTGKPGTSAVIPKHLDKSQCFTMLMSSLKKNHVPQFFCYYFNSKSAQMWFELEGWGTAQTNISVPILKQLLVAIPTFDEQKEIVAFIETSTRKIDELVNKVETAIEHLREYRAALISSVVTGKIDVGQERR